MNLTRNVVLVFILAANILCFPMLIAEGHESEKRAEWKTYHNKSLGLSIRVPDFFEVIENGERNVEIYDNVSLKNISMIITSSPLKKFPGIIEQYTKLYSKPKLITVNKHKATMFMSMSRLKNNEILNMFVLLHSKDNTFLHFAFLVSDRALNQVPMRILDTLELD